MVVFIRLSVTSCFDHKVSLTSSDTVLYYVL